MGIENNLTALFFAILPVALYMFLIFKFIPQGFINTRRSRRYFVVGLLSPMLVTIANFVFPALRESNCGLILFCVFNIGLVEELTKYITYYWTTKERKSAHEDYPISVMYYVLLTSLGFALVENIDYLRAYGNQVLFIRATSAIVLHMLCGVITGYFISKSRNIKPMYTIPQNSFELLVNDYIRYGKCLFIVGGVFIAAIVHGIYDYNCLLPGNINQEFTMYVILGGTLIIGYFMIRELIKDSLKIRGSESENPGP